MWVSSRLRPADKVKEEIYRLSTSEGWCGSGPLGLSRLCAPTAVSQSLLPTPTHRATDKLAAKYKVRQQRIMAIVALKTLERQAEAAARSDPTHPPPGPPAFPSLPIQPSLSLTPPILLSPQGQKLYTELDAMIEKETGVVSEGTGEKLYIAVRAGSLFSPTLPLLPPPTSRRRHPLTAGSCLPPFSRSRSLTRPSRLSTTTCPRT